MFGEPDTAQFSICLVLGVLLFFGIMAFSLRFLSNRAQGRAALTAVLAMMIIVLSALYGYGTANSHWNSLTEAIDEQRIESVSVEYPRDQVESQKTYSIENVFKEHADVPFVKVRQNSQSTECGITVEVVSCSAGEAADLVDSLIDVYGCRTTMYGSGGFITSVPA